MRRLSRAIVNLRRECRKFGFGQRLLQLCALRDNERALLHQLPNRAVEPPRRRSRQIESSQSLTNTLCTADFVQHLTLVQFEAQEFDFDHLNHLARSDRGNTFNLGQVLDRAGNVVECPATEAAQLRVLVNR